ncbi:Asp23/Gls24 family envelope stress response protein [Salinithrix halophila]|uniref:Asp23/Gls24 family envelope stress response protein n=1 Tax=Salinithrix halophila TaxID=1485204 RepID=A0ABV8JHN4_9BACL
MENEIQHREAHVTELGKVEIAPEVIQIIAGLAAVQVDGVSGTSGGVVGDITQFLGRKNLKQGVKVELSEDAHITVSVIVQYGHYIPRVGKEVQERVKSTVESMTGLAVSAVTTRIVGVKFVGDNERESQEQEPSQRVN